MISNSSWSALRIPLFRRLWIASVVSGTCVAAHDNAATWMISQSSGSTFLISLIPTAASLPFFLFTLPAGILADSVNRKKLACIINLWLAVTAVALAILGWLQLLSPGLILAGVFFLGIGFAFNAPTWTAIVPQVVSDSDLPSAGTLSGLQFNISGIVGPALASLLVPTIGANFIFGANALCFVLVILAIAQWKQTAEPTKILPSELPRSSQTVISYIRCAPGLRTLLTQNALFSFFISAIPAVAPVAALKLSALNSSNLGLLFMSMGVGSVAGALFVVPWCRARFSSNTLVTSANLLIIAAYGLMGFVHQTELFLVAATIAGVGWTMSASERWVAIQRATPSWARGRLNAIVTMLSQGATVLGGLIWGALDVTAGPSFTLLGAALLFLVSLFLSTRFSVNFRTEREAKASSVVCTA